MEMNNHIKSFIFIFFGSIIFIMSIGAFVLRLLFACFGLYFIFRGLQLRGLSTTWWDIVIHRWNSRL